MDLIFYLNKWFKDKIIIYSNNNNNNGNRNFKL